ncbi:MAG: winged helix DNA-binding domain-containing protein [Marinilabiliales bacterium]|nr:winged helix DNA-binding domain-containing protein [Marinilabiliales bacterium]
MESQEILSIRLKSHLLTGSNPTGAAATVRHMAAMQAQDFRMAKWAIGIRSPQTSEQEIQQAIDSGDIIRIHLLRPTWHFAAPEDVRWMLDLSGARIRSAMASNDKKLGLAPEDFRRSNQMLEKLLRDGQSLTRDELIPHWEAAGIGTMVNRPAHLLMHAETEQIICSGPFRKTAVTYALLDERIPASPILSREEALGTLALRYFTGHGPATLPDFCWWSGLSLNDCRKAISLVENRLLSEHSPWGTLWFAESSVLIADDSFKNHLLPAYDEFIIGYRQRETVIGLSQQKKAISSNGVFRPVLLRNGQAVGLWRTAVVKGKTTVERSPFENVQSREESLFEEATERYLRFAGKNPGKKPE